MNAVIFIIIFVLVIVVCSHVIIKPEHYKDSPKSSQNIAIVSLVRQPVDFPVWLKHHRDMGVSRFYLRFEDTRGWEDILKHDPSIFIELGESGENNYESLQERQYHFVMKVIEIANNENIDWLIHIDSDELLNGSLDVFNNIKSDIQIVKIENMEAVYSENEKGCFTAKRFIRCLEGECRSYSNGKAACRPGPDIDVGGPHDFLYKTKVAEYDIPYKDLNVLHFDSCTIGAWVDKFNHISKDQNGEIPFSYYTESIDKVKDIYNTYKGYVVDIDIPDNAKYEI